MMRKILIAAAVLSMVTSGSAATWKLDPRVTPAYAKRVSWDGADNILLRPVDTNFAGKVFVESIPVPSADFDVTIVAGFCSKPNLPCRIGVDFEDGAGASKRILLRADGVEDAKFPRLVFDGTSQHFLLKHTNGVVTVYWAEGDAAYVKMCEVAAGFVPAKVNLSLVPNLYLNVKSFALAPFAPVPRRRTQHLFAADASRFQPMKPGSVVVEKSGQVPLPVTGRTSLQIGFDKNPTAGIVYLTFGEDSKETALPVYVMKDTYRIPSAIRGVCETGETREIPNARVSVGYLGSQSVAPALRPFAASRHLCPDGEDMLREWPLIENDARKHVLKLEFEPDEKGDLRVWIDGSYARTYSKPKKLHLSTTAGCRYRVEPRASRAGRFLPLALGDRPKALAFADARLVGLAPGMRTLDGVPFDIAAPLDSQDVSLAKLALGEWGLGSNGYRGRQPTDGYPMEVRWRAPSALYTKAHLVFALDPDPKKRRAMRLRLARFDCGSGVGSNKIVETTVDFVQRLPESVVRIGEVELNGRKLPLYRTSVALPIGECIDFANDSKFIDFEAVGMKDEVQDSAFNLFAVTLEKAPFTLDIRQQAAGNLFTADEPDKCTFVHSVAVEPGAALLRWTIRNLKGRRVGGGSRMLEAKVAGESFETAIDLNGLKDWGLYNLDIELCEPTGRVLVAHPARVAIVPPSGRLADKDITASPYCTWWFHDVHGGYADRTNGFRVLRKLGLHKVTWIAPTRAESEEFQIIGDGSVKMPNPDFFDFATGKYKSRDGMDGETWVVENIRKQIASKLWVDHLTVWHENAPMAGVPEEVLGEPVPSATDADRRHALFFNEAGRIARKHFPNLRLKIGNSLGSSGACFRPFRGGAKPEYFDSIGMEPVNGGTPSEVLSLDCLQGMQLSRAAAEHYVGKRVAVDGCHEFVSRPVAHCRSEEAQARYYMRDILLCLANDYRLITAAGPFDVSTSYFDTVWGGGACMMRAPFVYPRQFAVAYAVITKMVDAPVARRVRLLDRKDVMCVEFTRADGKVVTAFWTTRGEADVVCSEGGTRVAMLGEHSKVGGLLRKKILTVTEEPCYLVSAKPQKTLSVVARRFPEGEAAAKAAGVVAPLVSMDGLTVEPEPWFECKGHGSLPYRKPSKGIVVREAEDPVRGKALEITAEGTPPLASKFLTEYTTIRFENPVALPEDAKEVGLWVKGDAGRGELLFEVEDADGNVYKNQNVGVRMCFDYDGWDFLHFPLDAAYQQSWYRTRIGRVGQYLKPPIKVRSITVTLNRFAPILDDMRSIDAKVRISSLSFVK